MRVRNVCIFFPALATWRSTPFSSWTLFPATTRCFPYSVCVSFMRKLKWMQRRKLFHLQSHEFVCWGYLFMADKKSHQEWKNCFEDFLGGSYKVYTLSLSSKWMRRKSFFGNLLLPLIFLSLFPKDCNSHSPVIVLLREKEKQVYGSLFISLLWWTLFLSQTPCFREKFKLAVFYI